MLQILTEHRPTFTTRDIQRTINRHIRDASERERFLQEILAHPDAVRLSKTATGPAIRYTAKPILETEQAILRTASRLTHARQHSVSASMRGFVLRRPCFQTLSPEQTRAVSHTTGPDALTLIDGQAGTGKTYVLQAVREIYQAQGYRVIGLAPTNAVARVLKQDGFAEARTLHSELYALDHHRAAWTSRTAIVVDEAAMIDSRNLARLLAHADATGAKLILAGDDRQLSSIDPGGMFAVLKARFGAAELTEVYRQRQAKDRRASQLMAGGNFREALSGYNNAIHWTETTSEAMNALVQKWARDSANDNTQSRFVFAYTNRDVNRLNAALHDIREQRGELVLSHRFITKHGAAQFSAGDRLQFTDTDKTHGLFNGELGTVQAIDGSRLTVAVDGPGKHIVSFDADRFQGFRHGYAGTIHKGQGRTIDQTYLLHSEHWRAAPSYVALTRHREDTAIFVARDTAADIDDLARQMARTDDNRAASAFLEPESRPSRSVSGDMLKQFGEAKHAITAKVEAAPKPKPSRKKRGEDTRGLFKRLATKILVPMSDYVIFALGDSNCFTPPEPLDETQRRLRRERQAQHWQLPPHNQPFSRAPLNYLSPRL